MQAHLKAQSFYSVVANIRGRSAEEVAGPLLDSQELRGLQVGSASCASMQTTHYVWMVKYSNVWVVCMLRSKPDLVQGLNCKLTGTKRLCTA